MSQIQPGDFPRILSLESFGVPQPATTEFPAIPLSSDFCEAFEAATGWTLGFQESKPSRDRRARAGLQDAPATGKLFIDDMSAQLPAGQNAAHRGKCDAFVGEIDKLIGDLQRTKLQMYGAQAELACQIPVIPSPEESYRLAELLAALLNTAAEACSCGRAALYLIGEDSEWLLMRASVGLQGKQFASERRLMATSKGDVEAMSGFAVVASNVTETHQWNVPEPCQSAACVPVSSTTTILGSLWVFGDTPQDFTDEQINLLEIIAGRIAAELERQVLIQENLRLKKTSSSKSARIECHPVIDPPFDGWKLEGQCGQVGQKFTEWDVTDSEEIRLTVGTEGASTEDKASASIFVDPLTTEFQVHGRVQDVAFWLWDRDTGVVFDIDEWAQPMYLEKSQWLVATTVDDAVTAQNLLEAFERGEASDELVLCLYRV